MSSLKKGSPGPVARSAFRTGMVVATVVGLLALVALYLLGASPLLLGYLLLVGFPIYLVFAAAFVNAWLGYGSDAIPLERVTVPADADSTDYRIDEAATPVRSEDAGPSVLDDPRSHLALILGTVVVGLSAWVVGYPSVTVFALLFAFLATVTAMNEFLWPRLMTYYERRRATRSESDAIVGFDALSAEYQAGMTVAVLVCLLIVAASLVFALVA